MPRKLKPCGTDAAWQRHRANNEEACDACKEARKIYKAEASRKYRKAYPYKFSSAAIKNKAYISLRAWYLEEYTELYNKYKSELSSNNYKSKNSWKGSCASKARVELARRYPDVYEALKKKIRAELYEQ